MMRLEWVKERKNWIVVGFGLTIILFAILVLARGVFGGAKVTVASVKKQSFKPGVFGVGTVDARLSYSIGPTQAGRVLKVYVDQGDKVSAGKVLGEMDPVDLDQKLTSAAASVAKAVSARMVSEAQVKDAASRYTLAKTTAERYNKLFASNAISREMADIKNNEANAAQAAYESAMAALESAQGEVARANAEYSALGSQKSNLQLISPVNGLIVARDAEPGATVVAGQSVFRMVDPATIWVRTRIDQGRFQGIAVGQDATITLRSRPDQVLQGKVARLEVQADSVTEERFVNVVFNQLPGILPLGELAEVTIEFPGVSDALLIPAAAVKRQGKQSGVWVVDEGRLKFRPVEIGAQSLDGKVQVVRGLAENENVVVYSAQLLNEGMKVRVETAP